MWILENVLILPFISASCVLIISLWRDIVPDYLSGNNVRKQRSAGNRPRII